ncbi:MAG: type II secretion system F family protein, partial [Deltaproteobacteria bacterium]
NFLSHQSILIQSGLSLIKSLQLIASRTGNPDMRKVIEEIARDVEEGSSFWKACSRHGEVFTPLQVNTIKAGEISGSLPEVLIHLVEHGENELELQSKIRGALLYPAAVFVIGLGVLAFLIGWVTPMFAEFFQSASFDIPAITKVLVVIGNVMQTKTFWVLFVLALFLLFILYTRLTQTEAGKYAIDRFRIRLPVFGELITKGEIIRFAQTFAILLRSGVPILHALDLVAETAGNRVIGASLSEMKYEAERGGQLDTPLRKNRFVEPLVADMVAVGQESGQLPEVLSKLALKYKREVNILAENITSKIAPILLVVMGLMAGFIVVSLYMPYFKMFHVLSAPGL